MLSIRASQHTRNATLFCRRAGQATILTLIIEFSRALPGLSSISPNHHLVQLQNNQGLLHEGILGPLYFVLWRPWRGMTLF
jgi:hypothetical protein